MSIVNNELVISSCTPLLFAYSYHIISSVLRLASVHKEMTKSYTVFLYNSGFHKINFRHISEAKFDNDLHVSAFVNVKSVNLVPEMRVAGV